MHCTPILVPSRRKAEEVDVNCQAYFEIQILVSIFLQSLCWGLFWVPRILRRSHREGRKNCKWYLCWRIFCPLGKTSRSNKNLNKGLGSIIIDFQTFTFPHIKFLANLLSYSRNFCWNFICSTCNFGISWAIIKNDDFIRNKIFIALLSCNTCIK